MAKERELDKLARIYDISSEEASSIFTRYALCRKFGEDKTDRILENYPSSLRSIFTVIKAMIWLYIYFNGRNGDDELLKFHQYMKAAIGEDRVVSE